ncbi:MAG TPA: YrdB family protein [Gaiellaceae bacterium]|nr:YrdB family protein [Gaiellaceae bacterium]
MKAVNLAVRFACELAMLVAFVWWGWPVAGIVGAVAAAVVWGLFIGPKARRRLPDPARFLLELTLFAAATAAFIDVGQSVLAVAFAIAAVVTASLVRVWPEPVA